jgi:hypothetical protein
LRGGKRGRHEKPSFLKKDVFDGAQEKLMIDQAVVPKIGERCK